MFKFVIALLLIICVSMVLMVHSQQPIPGPVPDGFLKLGPAVAPIDFEVIGDLSCTDMADWYLNVFEKSFIPYYFSSYSSNHVDHKNNDSNDVRFTFHLYPLPFHIAAFDTSVASLIVQKMNNNNMTFNLDFAHNMFANQRFILNEYVEQSKSRYDILDIIYDKYMQPLQINKDAYFQRAISTVYSMRARASFKLACSRGVSSSPAFFVNGVQIYDGDSKTFDDWKKLFDQVKSSNLP